MHYYIDGYNLLFRNCEAKDQLQKYRDSLLEYFNKSIHLLGLNATIVFDSQYREGEATRGHLIDLEVIFTGEGETADDYIVKALESRHSVGIQMVVTSDKKLAWRARLAGALTQTSEDFLSWMERRIQNKQKKPSKKKNFIQPLVTPQAKPEVSKELSITSTAEECVDYYQSVFESRYNEMEASKPVRKSSKPKKIKKKIPSKEEPTVISDYDRWLNIFEKKTLS